MKGKIAVVVMAVLLVFYLVLVGTRAVLFIQSGEIVGVVIGIALLILPLIGFWALAREVSFGIRSERLMRQLDELGELPADLPVRPSGRPYREAADEQFPAAQAEVEAEPENWRAWLRLGLAYDASGDRKRARGAIRTAIDLERTPK
jgi:cytochrome c-type biogenesis protein CcmH/NrfG